MLLCPKKEHQHIQVERNRGMEGETASWVPRESCLNTLMHLFEDTVLSTVPASLCLFHFSLPWKTIPNQCISLWMIMYHYYYFQLVGLRFVVEIIQVQLQSLKLWFIAVEEGSQSPCNFLHIPWFFSFCLYPPLAIWFQSQLTVNYNSLWANIRYLFEQPMSPTTFVWGSEEEAHFFHLSQCGFKS